jgi:hypothetical protein
MVEATVDAACLAADRLGAPLLVVATDSGRTALALSNRRPAAAILAVTRTEQVARLLAVCWGVTAAVNPGPAAAEQDMAFAIDFARSRGLVAAGHHVVLLRGQVPGGDPYLLHVNVLTTGPLGPGDLFELQSGPPVQPRALYVPTPSNARVVLVRPTDRLRLLIGEHAEVKVELLIESIGGVNELGSRMFDWAHAQVTHASSMMATWRAGAPRRGLGKMIVIPRMSTSTIKKMGSRARRSA